jgi:hypothetical protein
LLLRLLLPLFLPARGWPCCSLAVAHCLLLLLLPGHRLSCLRVLRHLLLLLLLHSCHLLLRLLLLAASCSM